MGMKNGKPVLLPEHLEFLVNTSGLSEPQVKTKYEHFLKEYPDNRITHSGFQDMIEQVRSFCSRISGFTYSNRLFLASPLKNCAITCSGFTMIIMTAVSISRSSCWSTTV